MEKTPVYPGAPAGIYPAGGNQLAYASAAPGQNNVYLYRFRVVAPEIVSGCVYEVGSVQNGNVDIGIYTFVPSTRIATRIGSSGAVAQGATSTLQTVPFTANIPLWPNVDYVCGFVCDSATGTWCKFNGTTACLFDADMVTIVAALGATLPTSINYASVSASGIAHLPYLRLVRAA